MIKRGFGSKLVPGYEKCRPIMFCAMTAWRSCRSKDCSRRACARGNLLTWWSGRCRNSATSSLSPTGSCTFAICRSTVPRQAIPSSGRSTCLGRPRDFIFVNPAYALPASQNPTGAAKAALRTGRDHGRGLAAADRPIFLQLREPQTSVARAIEQRIINRFGDPKVAAAHDEGLVQLFVPTYLYGSDWQHFIGVVTHTYLNASPEFAAAKARQLVIEAAEAGCTADGYFLLLGRHRPAGPAVHCAAAGKPNSRMCSLPPPVPLPASEIHPAQRRRRCWRLRRPATTLIQLNAVQTLGSLPHSAAVDHMLRLLLDSEKALVRIEAYKILARDQRRQRLFPRHHGKTDQPEIHPRHRSVAGTALIYATRTGYAADRNHRDHRRASTRRLFTRRMNNRLSISSGTNDTLTLFYRDRRGAKAHQDALQSGHRRGGCPPRRDRRARGAGAFDFSYCEIVAILQSLSRAAQADGCPGRTNCAGSICPAGSDAASAAVYRTAQDRRRASSI